MIQWYPGHMAKSREDTGKGFKDSGSGGGGS